MSQFDVSVLFGLEVARDRFRADLDAMRADFEQFRQQAAGTPVEIPVRIRDEATGQLRGLLSSLQAEASGGITIPVSVSGALGGSGFGGGGRLVGFPAIAAAVQANAGATVAGGYTWPAATAAATGTWGMTRAQLQTNIENVSDAMDARTAMFDAAAMGAGGAAGAEEAAEAEGKAFNRSTWRGMRLMSAVYMAARSIEGVDTSYKYAFDRDADVDQGSIAERRERIKERTAMRAGLFHLVGIGRDILSSNFGNALGRGLAGIGFPSASAFDDTADQASDEADIKHMQRMQRDVGAASRGTGLLQSTTDFMALQREALAEAQAPEGLDKKLAELHKAATRLTDSFNKQADELDKQAEKLGGEPQLQKALRDQAATFRAQGPGIAAGMETAAGNEVKHDFNVRQATTRAAFDAHLAQLGQGVTAATDILAGDEVGARSAEIESRRLAASNAASSAFARQRPGDPYNITKSQLNQELSLIDRDAALQTDIAKRSDSIKWATLGNRAIEAGIESPFERQRFAIEAEAATQRTANPAHAGDIDAFMQAGLADINRREGRTVQRLQHETQEISILGDRNVPLAAGRQRSAALALLHRTQEALQQASGAGDADLRQSIREHAAAQAEEQMRFTSDVTARNQLFDIAHYRYSGSDPHSAHNPAQSGQPANQSGDAMSAAKAIIDFLRTVGHVAVIDE